MVDEFGERGKRCRAPAFDALSRVSGYALLFMFGWACTKPAPPRPDSEPVDGGVLFSDATIMDARIGGMDADLQLDAAVNPDAAAIDSGVFEYPEALTLLSEGGATYRFPSAITVDVQDPSLIYFSALTLDNEAAIFLLSNGQATVIFSGGPLVLPVDLLVSANSRSLYIADLAAGEHGQVFRLDLRLRTLEVYASGDNLWGPAGLALDNQTPALLITGRFPDSDLGSIFELLPGEQNPLAIPFGPDLVLNDPSHLIWQESDQTFFVYEAHHEANQKGQVYMITAQGDFTVIADNISATYPASMAVSPDQNYLLVSTSTPSANGGDTIHVVDLRHTPPMRRALVLGQKIKEPRAIHQIKNTDRWLIIDARGGSANQGAIYQLQ